MRFLNNGWASFIVFIFIILFWQGATDWYQVDKWMLPAPTDIWETFIQKAQEDLWMQVWATSRIALLGWAWGIGIGVLVAVILHLLPMLKKMIYPYLLVSQNIPLIVLAPLLVIWLGFGDTPKILVVVLICFFPITIALLDGFQQTDRTLRLYLLMSGASKFQLLTKLELPSAYPSLFSGLKISATYSVMGAVVAEWLGAKEGLGLMMKTAATSFRTDRVFVGIILIILLSLVLFGLVSLLERWLTRWRRREVG